MEVRELAYGMGFPVVGSEGEPVLAPQHGRPSVVMEGSVNNCE
jgi:hypothetical protein